MILKQIFEQIKNDNLTFKQIMNCSDYEIKKLVKEKKIEIPFKDINSLNINQLKGMSAYVSGYHIDKKDGMIYFTLNEDDEDQVESVYANIVKKMDVL